MEVQQEQNASGTSGSAVGMTALFDRGAPASREDRRRRASAVSTRPEAPHFRSILFGDAPEPPGAAELADQDFVHDLRLDAIVEGITAGRASYDLAPFYYEPLADLDAVAWRHEVFRDLESLPLLSAVRTFADHMLQMRECLVRRDKGHYAVEQQRWFLDATARYCEAVSELAGDGALDAASSRGVTALRDFLRAYVASKAFAALHEEVRKVQADLAGIRYRLQIQGNRVRVSRFDGEPNYSVDVLATFDKFKQAAGEEYSFKFSSWPEMNHIEAAIAERVARLYPAQFGALEAFCARHAAYLDATIARFDREVQFYVAYIEHMARFRSVGLSFCYPAVSDASKSIRGRGVFDLALAARLVKEGVEVIVNDFELTEPERVFVVSGPNQGGKTTFARTIGQLHHLARLGVPVPGSEASLYLVDAIYSHFEREEDLQNLSGKLEDELRRIHAILDRATSSSLLVMNESFGSTTVQDAVFLGKEIVEAIVALDCLCVSVTFLDELASLGPTIVSLMSTINPDDPAVRTFRVVRKPADGLAYAAAIAAKYGLTYRRVKDRVSQ